MPNLSESFDQGVAQEDRKHTRRYQLRHNAHHHGVGAWSGTGLVAERRSRQVTPDGLQRETDDVDNEKGDDVDFRRKRRRMSAEKNDHDPQNGIDARLSERRRYDFFDQQKAGRE